MDERINLEKIMDTIEVVSQDYIDVFDTYLDKDQFNFFVLYIYLSFDQIKGFGMDFKGGLSIALGQKIVSVIGEGRKAVLYTLEPIVQYQNLEVDIDSIFMNVCSCIDEWRSKVDS